MILSYFFLPTLRKRPVIVTTIAAADPPPFFLDLCFATVQHPDDGEENPHGLECVAVGDFVISEHLFERYGGNDLQLSLSTAQS